MTTVIFTIDKKIHVLKLILLMQLFQLFNESIIKDILNEWPIKIDKWYSINDNYGWWVLKNEFPNIKGNEFIKIEYI